MGTVLKLRQQEAPNVDSIPRSLFEDDHITLEEIVEEIEAKHSSEAVRTVLADWLQYAGIMGKHAVLRFILLHEAFDLECPELSGTLIECVRRNDLQGLLIFMECCIDVEKLLDDNELFNAAYIGSDILANLELILQRRKARGLTSGKEHYPLLVQKDGHERAALGGGQTTLLHCTIIANNWDGFCVLISRGNVDIQDEAGGMTALHLAIILGRPMFAIVLLLMGTNCKEVIENEVGTFGQTTLLHLACRPVRASTAYDMHEVYRVDEDGVHTGPIEGPFRSEPPLKAWQILILVLLENSFDINASDENRITPIRYLIRAEGSLDRIQFLHSLGADLNVPDSNGETALHTCCYNDDIPLDVAKFIVENSSATLLNSGSATSDPTKPSILSLASQKGRLDFCRLLLAKGTRLTLRDKLRFDDDEPWIELTGPDAPQLEEVDQLLEKLSDIPINSEIEELIVCVSKKQGKIHVFLDCVEPHINSSDIVGRTRLHTAVLNGDVEAVELLLSLGAILGRKDWAGLTALHYAYAVGDKAIIEVLENAERGKNEAAISFEGQNGDDEPESPSITPKEVGDIVRGRRDLWDGYCRRSNAEMIRRAGE
jgi:ankyrin repeat protein